MKDQVAPRSVDFQIWAGPRSVTQSVPSWAICSVGSPETGVPCWMKALGAKASGTGGADLIGNVTMLLETAFEATVRVTESPGATPAGICTLTWLRPMNPGASPAKRT